MTTPTERLWDIRDRRVPAVAAAAALTGLPASVLRDAARVSLAASPQAGHLLAGMADAVRVLPMALTVVLERCVHSVRGPVIWSETITARANSLGNDDVFICSTTRRTFDTAENRALVSVLLEIAAASRALHGPLGRLLDPQDRERVADAAKAARQWRNHRRLQDVKPGRLRHRDLGRIRAGRHPESLATTLAAAARMHDPFCGEDVLGLSDDQARGMHHFLIESLDGAEPFLPAPRRFRLGQGALRCGPLAFRHPRAPGTAPAGLSIRGRPVRPSGGDLHGWPDDGEVVRSGMEVAELVRRAVQEGQPDPSTDRPGWG